MKFKLSFPSAILLILFVTVNCSDNSMGILNPDNNFSMDDILGKYDGSYIGMIYLHRNLSETKNFWNQKNIDSTDENVAEADFFNPANQSESYICDSLFINANHLEKLSPEFLHYVCGGDNINKIGMPIYFGNESNNLRIIGNENISSVDTNFYFIDPIKIINLHGGDTVNPSKGINVSWIGADKGYSEISLSRIDYYSSENTYSNNSIIKNTGKFSLTSWVLDYYPDGLYELEIKRIEPRFINYPNGKKIGVIAMPSHKISLYFKR